MLFADGALSLILLGLWLFCLIDVLTTDEAQVRNLPKLAWVVIVLLLFDLGSLAWLIAGRPWQGMQRPSTGVGRAFPEYDRPGRATAQNPEDDEEFLRTVRERAETQRRQYQARRQRELEAEQQRLREPPESDDPRLD